VNQAAPQDPVRLASVGVRYGERVALSGVSLGVPRGIVYALLGRNGAGKSSLVRCLLGLQKPRAGEAFLFGESAWRRRASLLSRVGVVPEEPDAPPEVTVARLAAFCHALHREWDAESVTARLRRFGVPDGIPFGRLSKGQKGLAMLALALASRPELLVLDDPTLGLDPIARRFLFDELIGELADRGTTVFLTTHDLSGVEAIADRVGILRDGALVLDEELDTLKSRFRRIRYANEATEERTFGTELDRFNAVRVKVRGWGVEAVVSDFDDDAFAGFSVQEGVLDAESSPMSLEEIFLAIVGEEKGARR
jgi:ABC-2 type transport system ATP-binding protein